MKNNKMNKKILVYFFCAIVSFLILLIGSKSSFLYPLNDWPDVNIFFTLGKGMVHGKVPYVDLIDQKGPYLYAISGLAYLLSRESFLGFFVLEMISIYFFLLYSWKIIGLYVNGKALWVLPILAAGIVSAKSFVHGGSIEELCLGVFAYSLYSMLLFLRQEDKTKMPLGTLLVNGIWAGIILWSKFTLLGFYIGWMIVVLLVYIGRKQWKSMIQAATIFVGSMVLVTIPWIIYFGINGAIGNWLNVYLYQNIFTYSASDNTTIFMKIAIAIVNAAKSLRVKQNFTYSILVTTGMIYFWCKKPKVVSWAEKLTVIFLGGGMALGIFIGGTKHDYYGLPLSVFSVLGGILLMQAFEFIKKLKLGNSKLLYGIWCFVLLGICMLITYRYSDNVYLLKVKKEQMPQYRFKEIISQSEDQTLLNYGFLDGGFYTVCNQVPTVPYFCWLNSNSNEIMKVQQNYILDGKTEFVVTWSVTMQEIEVLEKWPVVSEVYQLADYQYFFFEGDMRTYALYKKR